MQTLLRRFVKPLPPEETGRSYRRDELIQDLDFLIKTIEDVHPNPFFSCSEDTFRRETEKCKSRLKNESSRIEFYIEAAKLVSLIHDGHTHVHLPHDEFKQHKDSGGMCFPFAVDCSSGEAEVVEPLDDSQDVFPGEVIVKINDVPVRDILGEMNSLFGYERHEMRLSVISKKFGWLHFILFGGHEQYNLLVRSKNGDKEVRSIGVSKERIKSRTEKSQATYDSPYEYYLSADKKAAILDFRSFESPDKFRPLMKRMFSEVEKKGIHRLIVDLRRNGGGNSMLSDIFFHFITDKSLRQNSRMELKVSKQIREYYKAVMKIMAPFPLRHLPARFTYPLPWRKAIGEIAVERGARRKPSKPVKMYKIDLYVVTGSNTFSSASDFAALVKDNALGTIVGQPTGGLASCYGDMYPFSLPKTFLSCGVSHKLFVRPNGDEKPSPVFPDIELPLSYQNASIDNVYEYVMNL
jgi:C-terminal processing protease CtpA/Prc